MPAMPARQAIALGRIMVVPSRAESLPYVVLEAAAAGMPLIATGVGGIPEIYGPLSDTLVPPRRCRARWPQAIAAGARQPGRDRRHRAKPARARGGVVFGRNHGRRRAGRLPGRARQPAQKPAAVKTYLSDPISLS